MKLLLREFVAALRERDELDAILPDILSELGFNVYSRPSRGTKQYGVDIAAVGSDGGAMKLFLFSVKQGDLTRQDWDGTPQALRSSLNEIRDVYVPNHVPHRYRGLPVVICLCFGGDVQEAVRAQLTGYINSNTTSTLSFDEWNGDRIAGYLLDGVLRETLLPRDLRSDFQKAVALADEPDVAYHHFSSLVEKLSLTTTRTSKSRATTSRLIYICLWVLYVWARDVDNLDAPYRCSELAILSIWNMLRPFIGKRDRNAKALFRALNQVIELHFSIASRLLDQKITPHVAKRYAISLAVPSRSALDVNLALFDLLGRMATTGLWLAWFIQRLPENEKERASAGLYAHTEQCFALIANNPTLFSPISDNQVVDIALLLQLCLAADGFGLGDAQNWIARMAERLDFALRVHGRYACIYTEYADLAEHPRERSIEYRRDATAGSVLIPVLGAWLAALKDQRRIDLLHTLTKEILEHCTLQLWMPDNEDAIYTGDSSAGVALLDLAITGDGSDLLNEIQDATLREGAFGEFSPVKTGYWPILFVASRHFRLPVSPHFWITALQNIRASSDGAVDHPPEGGD